MDKGGERNRAIDGDDSGIAADVTELIVGGTGEDLAAETTHEAYTWRSVLEVIGARGSGDGIIV